ncbi:MAG: Peptidase inactive domain protein [Acidobacteria bacterium]|nr:Peptidase inactive domain protein [Acidobacteriota bacterium]
MTTPPVHVRAGLSTRRRLRHRDTETQSAFEGYSTTTYKKVSVSLWLCGLLISVSSLSLCVGTAAAQSANWPTERPPQPGPARDIKFPPYEIQTLPNGLQVVVVMHHEQPAVTMRLLVRAGTSSDPREKLGLAHLASSLLDQGTKAMSAQEMNDAVDFIGGAMGAGAGTDLTFVNMVVMKDSFDAGLKMLSDMARQPAFAPAEIERQRQQMLSGQKVSAEDPGYIANSVFDRLVYGFHPYGMPESGTPQTIGALTREDLLAFHSRFFVPNNAILAIVGDVTAAEAFTAAKKVFNDWQKRDLPAQTFVGPPDPTRRVIVVNKPDAVQTEVRVGHIGIPRTHPDYMAVNLAIRILGGEGSNRLHQVLRTERGLTYGAQANMDTLKESGDFEAETNTRSEATGEVLRLIVDEFWRMQRERVGERELDGAKAYLTGSFPLTIETPESIAMQVVNALFYGLPLAELQNFRERVNAVTPDDIQRVAKALLRPDRLSVVLVGNSAAFASQLRGVGFPTFETVELDDLDLTSASFKRSTVKADAAVDGAGWAGPRRLAGSAGEAERSGHAGRQGLAHGSVPRGSGAASQYQQAPLASRPSDSAPPEETAKAIALLDKVIATKGGLATLRALKSIVAKQTQVSQRPEGESSVATTNYIEYPNHLRVETQGQVQAFDGTRVWMKDSRGIHDAPDAFVREMAAGLRRDVVALLLAAKDGTVTVRLLPDVKEADGQVSHALELSSTDLNPIVLYVDPQSNQIRKRVYAADAPGRPIIEEAFFDYRAVDGIQFAFRATQKVGAVSVERRVTAVTINTPLDPALFKRPAS